MGDWASNPGWYVGLTANLGLCAILVLAWMHSVEFTAPVRRHTRSLLLGLAMGAGAVLAMMMPVTVMPGVILDLRISLITLAGFFGGPVSAVIATVPALGYRAYVGGPGGLAGLAAIGLTALVGLTGYYLRGDRTISLRDLALLAAAAILAVLATFPLLPEDIWLCLLVTMAPPLSILNFIAILLLGLVFTQVELRRQLQRRITQASDQLRQVTDNLPGFVHSERTDQAGRSTDIFVSPGIRGILGVDAALAVENGLASFVHPEDREGCARRLSEAARSLSPVDCTVRMRHADGHWRWLQLRSRPRALADGVLRWDGIAIDVTDRIEAEQKLKWSETRFRAIFDSTFQFTGLVEPSGRVLEANRSALEFGGLRRDEVVGQMLWETRWWPADAPSQARLRDAIARARAGELMRYDVEVLGRNGARAIVDFSLKPIQDHRGRVVLIVVEGRDITERKRLEHEIAYLALHDPLTGLANRTLFRREFERMLARVSQDGTRVALMLVDLDGFKGINDTYGHAVGDWLLCEIAGRLPLDGRSEDVVARLGGDEFAVIAELGPGDADPEDLSERILSTLARPVTIGQLTLDPAASLGFVVPPDDGGDLDELLSNADRALYVAKGGRLRHRHYRAEMRKGGRPLGVPAGPFGYPAGLDEDVLDKLLQPSSDAPSGDAGSDRMPDARRGVRALGRRGERA